jgi:hypothetical protein
MTAPARHVEIDAYDADDEAAIACAVRLLGLCPADVRHNYGQFLQFLSVDARG